MLTQAVMNVRMIPIGAILILNGHWYKRVSDIKKNMSSVGLVSNAKFVNVDNKKDIQLFYRGFEVEKVGDKYKPITTKEKQ